MKNEPNQQVSGQRKILLNPILAMIVVLSIGCTSQSDDTPTASGKGNTRAAGSAGQWKTYTHPKLGVSVRTPQSWNVSPGKAFSAYSGEGLASVLMSRAQIIPRSPATTAADFL